MSKKLLFVYNPKAGKERIKSNLADILDVFASRDYEITIAPTRKQGDAEEIVANRDPGIELVVCSGGDGTLDETVTGMIRSGIRTPIGYIPAGSTNDAGQKQEPQEHWDEVLLDRRRKVKQERARGGCLGTGSRRKT